jgi:hypothetical protein
MWLDSALVFGVPGANATPMNAQNGWRHLSCFAYCLPMARHHLVPQTYLRRFANEKKYLVMVPRDDITTPRSVTVNNACNQAGFYEIPTDDLEVEAREGHDPEQVESILAVIENESKQYIDEILNGVFPPSPESRFRLSMYVAFQITRGWGFRRKMDEVAELVAPYYVEMHASPERIRGILRRQGRPHGPTDVDNMIARLVGPDGLRPVLRQGHYVQNMLELAMNLLPLLYQRVWRLLDFREPMLLTSDEPVAVRRSGDAGGIADSRAIWFPLDRQHALAFTQGGIEGIVPSARTRANQINSIIANQAHRWIFHHPDDNPLAGLEIGPRMTLVEEVVDVKADGDTIRELVRLVERPVERAE